MIGLRTAAIALAVAASACTSPAAAPPNAAADESAAKVVGEVGAPAAPTEVTGEVTPEYREDVRKICNAEQLSGAAEQDPGTRPVHMAVWLGNQITTQAGRDLMARQARLSPTDKRELFLGEARRAGLANCPTVDLWRQ